VHVIILGFCHVGQATSVINTSPGCASVWRADTVLAFHIAHSSYSDNIFRSLQILAFYLDFLYLYSFFLSALSFSGSCSYRTSCSYLLNINPFYTELVAIFHLLLNRKANGRYPVIFRFIIEISLLLPVP